MSLTADRTNDPVCGMIVDKAIALQAEREGETFYFCSDYCRWKFITAPAVAPPAKAQSAEKAVCGCG